MREVQLDAPEVGGLERPPRSGPTSEETAKRDLGTEACRAASVTLVYPPFGAIERPSLALGLLRAQLERAGIATEVEYANLDFAAAIGAVEYGFWEETLGELAFAGAAFPGWEPDRQGFVRAQPAAAEARVAGSTLPRAGEEMVAAAAGVREAAAACVDRVALRVVARGPRIVGCSATFVQHTAALALLRRLRELAPETITLLGGASCETVMGRATHRSFPWVDFVVSGEADELIVRLCRTLLEKGRDAPASELPLGVFGPAHRKAGYPTTTSGDPYRRRGPCRAPG